MQLSIQPAVRARILLLLLVPLACDFSAAQAVRYAGALAGIATLSADAGSLSTPQGLSLSAYSPENGAALNLFAGIHFRDHFSVQVNYIFNQNDLLLSSTTSASNTFYEQARSSSQHALIFDFLIYFRRRDSRIRPYLGTGTGLAHFSSDAARLVSFGGAPTLPPASFSSNRIVLRSHVGIDLRLTRKLDFRYSFSEMLGGNEISRHLSPPAPRRLANFQNLFGFVVRF